MKTKPSHSQRRIASRKGSVLLVAVILGAAVALSLGTFLYIASTELRLSHRTNRMSVSHNVADTGIEEVLAVLNYQTSNAIANPTIDPLTDSLNPLNTGVWTAGEYDGVAPATDRRKVFTNVALTSQGVSSSASALLLSTSIPRRYYVVSKALTSAPSSGGIEKYSWAFVRRMPAQPPGLYARFMIEMLGNNVTVDSYRSSLGIYGAAIASSYGGWQDKNIFSNGLMASVDSYVDIGQADVYGIVATGGPDPADYVGRNGVIGEWGDTRGVEMDQTSTNFDAEFELEFPPADSTGVPVNIVLADPLPTTLGVAGASLPSIYRIPASKLLSTQLYTIAGPVRIIIENYTETVDPDTGAVTRTDLPDDNLSFSGNGAGFLVEDMPQLFSTGTEPGENGVPRLIDPGVPSLQVWTRADFAISGQAGINNVTANPVAVHIYGYAADTGDPDTAAQDFSFTGNQAIAAKIFAPNANLKLGGGGSDVIDMMGSVVAKNVTLNGKVAFHVDEDLAFAEDGKFGVSCWRELLTPDQRSGVEMGVGVSYVFGL